MRVNTVYPSLVYGPPGKKEGANVILRGILKGRYPMLVGARRKTAWIFLDDLVEGMVRLMEKAPPGRAYLMTGEIATLRSVVERTSRLGGVKAPGLDFPIPLARTALAPRGAVPAPPAPAAPRSPPEQLGGSLEEGTGRSPAPGRAPGSTWRPREVGRGAAADDVAMLREE